MPDLRPLDNRQPSPWIKEQPVGEALRNAYRQTLEEPLPPKLQKLIQKLREEERKKQT